MDWRSLTQVKELGVLITNCSCLAKDVQKVFNVYWDMGKENAAIPPSWPNDYSTNINSTNPISVEFNGNSKINTYLSVWMIFSLFDTIFDVCAQIHFVCVEFTATFQSGWTNTRYRCHCQCHPECRKIRSHLSYGLLAAHDIRFQTEVCS